VNVVLVVPRSRTSGALSTGEDCNLHHELGRCDDAEGVKEKDRKESEYLKGRENRHLGRRSSQKAEYLKGTSFHLSREIDAGYLVPLLLAWLR